MRYLHVSLVFLTALLLLVGCATPDDPVLAAVHRVFFPNPKVSAPARLDPRYHLLRISMNGSHFFLLSTSTTREPAEIWFSGTGEVLRLCGGRLCGASGLPIEWRQVVIPSMPTWSTLANMTTVYTWQRQRDVMPGYRFGVTDHLSLHSIPAPTSSDLTGVNPTTLHWFEEIDLNPNEPLPPTDYAVDLTQQQVVYSHTCLSLTFCFSWQRWPTHPGQ